jgi:dTDP-3-amino-3,4,6-trideoxy-alpha-D-glucose transaminase
MKIPFTGIRRQYVNLREEILDITDQVLATGQVMNGPWTMKFEDWLANKNHVKHAVTCHSGTQALELIAAFHLQYGFGRVSPTVLIPAMTYIATANAWARAGWNIHIVDTDGYGLIDPKKVPRDLVFHAVCTVGLYGAAYNRWFPNEGNYAMIEDGAQHWLANDCRRHGAACAISFDPTKNFANYGNGGAVVTNDRQLLDFARDWQSNGRGGGDADHVTNSRMSEVDCAQMMIKARYLNEWQARRETIARHWMERLAGTSVRCLIDSTNVDKHCFHKFVIDIDNRDSVMNKLEAAGITTKIHYTRPLHEEPRYVNTPGPDMMSAASSLARRGLSLPIYPELTDAEVEFIADQVISYVS